MDYQHRGSPLKALSVSITALLAMLASSWALASHAWSKYHWEHSSTPVTLILGSNLSLADWDEALVEAEGDWDTLAGNFGYGDVLSLSIATGSPSNLRRCSPEGGNIEICNDTYGFNGWLGVASISVQGGHITAASVKLNDSYHNLVPYNSANWRQYVMCQEVGHVFGLAHQDANFDNTNLGSCMDYTSDPSTNLQPNSHDFEQLAAIYSHTDGGATSVDDGSGGSSCRGGPKKCPDKAPGASGLQGSLDVNQPSQWGRLVSEHGPQEVFELDLGNGQKVITHVLWTVERARGAHDDH